jgi:hypothetical protein
MTMSDAILSPPFQTLAGVGFPAILAVRPVAGRSLKPTWGRALALSLLFLALGSFQLPLATAKSPMFAAAELFVFAGASFAAAAILVVGWLLIASRNADRVTAP